MAKVPYRFTPGRQKALRKAQLISARNRARGSGVAGLKANATPYVRTNKRSTTAGVNTGTVIPGTKKRVAVGVYVRLESTSKDTAVDKALKNKIQKIAPKGTKREKVAKALKGHIEVKSVGLRKSFGHAEARIGTSRSSGPTLIVRKGKHKVSEAKSGEGIKRYNKALEGKKDSVKAARPQRRKSS